jgi:hypothetical protein
VRTSWTLPRKARRRSGAQRRTSGAAASNPSGRTKIIFLSMSWSFDIVVSSPKSEYLENSQVLVEVRRRREKAVVQCPAACFNQ